MHASEAIPGALPAAQNSPQVNRTIPVRFGFARKARCPGVPIRALRGATLGVCIHVPAEDESALVVVSHPPLRGTRARSISRGLQRTFCRIAAISQGTFGFPTHPEAAVPRLIVRLDATDAAQSDAMASDGRLRYVLEGSLSHIAKEGRDAPITVQAGTRKILSKAG
jgi:hypothetical protein